MRIVKLTEKLHCNGCNREMTKEDIAITLSEAECCIWVEAINDGFWVDGEKFCSLDCFIGWLQQEIEQAIKEAP